MRIPALVLGKTGKVLSANSLIEAMSGYVYWRASTVFPWRIPPLITCCVMLLQQSVRRADRAFARSQSAICAPTR